MITVDGPPVPKGRARTVIVKGGRRMTFTPDRTTAYEERIGIEWLKQKPAERVRLEGPVAVILHVNEGGGAQADLDNYVKIALDALNKLAWDDDKQVVSINATITRRSISPNMIIVVQPCS